MCQTCNALEIRDGIIFDFYLLAGGTATCAITSTYVYGIVISAGIISIFALLCHMFEANLINYSEYIRPQYVTYTNIL